MAKTRRKPAARRGAKRKPVAKTLHAKRYPNESRAYRTARERLLKAEMALRKNVEAVAALRRRLPLGGAVPVDYEFEEGAADLDDTQTVRRVRMSELFGRDASLLVYNYMYGPAMAKACPMCTSSLAPSPMMWTPSTSRVSMWKISFSRPVWSPMIWPRAISR